MAMFKKDNMWTGKPASGLVARKPIKTSRQNSPQFNPLFIPQRGDKNLNWQQAKKKYPCLNPYGDYDDDGFKNYQDCHPLDPTRDGILSAIGGAISGAFGSKGGSQTASQGWREGMKQSDKELIKRKIRAAPLAAAEYSGKFARGVYRQVRPRGKVIVKNEKGELVTKYEQPISYAEKLRQLQQQAKSGRRSKGTIVAMKAMRMALPVIPESTIPSSTKYQGKKGHQGRGRPVGTTKYPGGIYQWRKVQRAAKAAAKYQTLLRQTQAMQQYPQMAAARAMQLQEQQQLQSQQQMEEVPQEMEGYQQPQIPQQKIQQYPQQIPQQYPMSQPQYPQVEKRPIATVFRGSGNHPYPPVSSQGLAPTSQTIPQGYVETVDSFTGRHFYKPIPKPEGWVR